MGSEIKVKRLGMLGGTFDPPHYGHLLLADTARVQLQLDQVLFAPAGQPPHKPSDQPSPATHRVAMLQAALADADEPAFHLSRLDLDRPGPHYTVDALTILRKVYPSTEMWFLIGGDSLRDLPHWRNPTQIITLARLAVLSRPGYKPNLDQLATKLPPADEPVDLSQRVDWLLGPSLDLSSSALRERARRGLPLRYLVPPSVEAYARKHGLYDEREKNWDVRRFSRSTLQGKSV
jgi:nicotinate-nucleotide adenylyltransferase